MLCKGSKIVKHMKKSEFILTIDLSVHFYQVHFCLRSLLHHMVDFTG